MSWEIAKLFGINSPPDLAAISRKRKAGLHQKEIASMDYTSVANLVGTFQDRWPQCFSVYERRRRPLKIGIDKDIEAAFAETVPQIEIKAALRFYCSNTGYLRACREGAERIGLDGSPAGTVTAREAGHCAGFLTYRLAKAAAKKAPAANGGAPVALLALPAPPKRLGLADLREAWQARQQRAAVSP